MKILEQCRISLPQGSAPESSSLPLTFFDIAFLDIDPNELCFFYQIPISTSPHQIKSHISNLKSSLSLTLQHFYPLVGKLKPTPHCDEHFELCYTQGDSVPFIVVENEDDFLDLTGCHPRELSRLKCLIPKLSESSLLAVQITVFPNLGICIGVSVSHGACDGFSLTHFIKSWAAATCRTNDSLPPPRPSFRRDELVAFHEFYTLQNTLRLNVKSVREASEACRISNTETDISVSATIKLGSEQIKRLKKKVQLGSLSSHCSTYAVTCAYLWICSVKLTRLAADKMTYFPINVDWRHRLQQLQGLPTYFGNCVTFHLVEMKVADILKDDGLKVASEAIGMAVEELKEGIGKSFEIGKEIYNRIATLPVLLVSGSPRFKLYDTDFGWGRPVKVELVSVSGEEMLLTESGEDPGGVQISLVRPKKEMEEFLELFKNGHQPFLKMKSAL